MVSVGRHPNIKLLTLSEIDSFSGFVGNFKVRIKRNPCYVDKMKCTGCGTCAEVCPTEVHNLFDQGLSQRRAIFHFLSQAVPGGYAIEKKGLAPCRAACPTHQRVQEYISTVRQKRYADAYWAIRREHPFPSVCGRVCNHRCEEACLRGKFDEPVYIMGIKRYVSDWAFVHKNELHDCNDKSIIGMPFQHDPLPLGYKDAIIGAGPAGLTAAFDLI